MKTTITVAVQNISHGGERINDDPGDRWELLFDRLRPVNADLLILNEATGFDANDNHKAHQFAAALDMSVAGVSPTQSDMPTAILYRADTLDRPRVWNPKHNYMSGHGFGLACWDVGLPTPLSLLGTHLSPFSPLQAAIEAHTAVTRAYRYGPYAIMAGDFNYSPLVGLPPDIDNMLPHNKLLRLHNPLSDNPTPNTDIAQAVRDGGFIDVAAELYDRSITAGTPDESYLAYTGRTDRIDWIAVSQPLREAITDYRLLDTPEAASDHHGISATLDLTACDTANPWTYR